MYTVKEVAQIVDLTEHTVRYYADNGLVPNLQRDMNNNRLFDEDSLNWLTSAKFLKQCGMSIKDIKKFVELCLEGVSTVQERYEIIVKQKAVALAQLEKAKRSIQYLERKENHFLDIINSVIPDNTNPGMWSRSNHAQVND